MKKTVLELIPKLLRIPGVLAGGALFQDKTVVTTTQGTTLTEAEAEYMWRLAGDTFRILRLHQLSTHWLKWNFTEFSVFCVQLDGITVGVLAGKFFPPRSLERVKEIVKTGLSAEE